MSDTAQVPRAHRARARTILARLDDIDRASVRPARAVASGYGTPDDEAALLGALTTAGRQRFWDL